MSAGPDPLDAVPPSLGREARHPLAGGRRVADGVATVALLVLASLLAVAAGWGITFLAFRFDSCGATGTSCDEGLGTAVIVGGRAAVAVVLVAAIALSVVRLVRRRLAWPVPLLAMGCTVGVFVLALVLTGSALR